MKVRLECCTDVLGPAELRKRVIDLKIVGMLLRKLEGGERDEVRMSLLSLDILGVSEICLHLHGSLKYSRNGKPSGASADCS